MRGNSANWFLDTCAKSDSCAHTVPSGPSQVVLRQRKGHGTAYRACPSSFHEGCPGNGAIALTAFTIREFEAA